MCDRGLLTNELKICYVIVCLDDEKLSSNSSHNEIYENFKNMLDFKIKSSLE
ncbi:hypothetical protein NHP164001_19730 [Helicobacter trogontum]|uniref:Uncharacterized protein n=1 Tax=Helicobacter trogontum TaxID=50960 RepID=A0ABQ0D6H3_9HELI